MNTLREEGSGPLSDPFDEIELYDNEKPREEISDLLVDFDLPSNGYSIVKNLEEFKERFNNFTAFFFEDFNWDGIVVAGGAILGNMINERRDEYNHSDVDLYFYGEKHLEKVKRTLNFFSRKDLRHTVTVMKRSISFWYNPPHHGIQIILPNFRSIEHVLYSSDIIPASIAFDGKRIYVSEQWRMCITHRYFPLTDKKNYYTAERAVMRAIKYFHRGFRIQMKDRNLQHYVQLLEILPSETIKFLAYKPKQLPVLNRVEKLSKFINSDIFLKNIKLEDFKNEFYSQAPDA